MAARRDRAGAGDRVAAAAARAQRARGSPRPAARRRAPSARRPSAIRADSPRARPRYRAVEGRAGRRLCRGHRAHRQHDRHHRFAAARVRGAHAARGEGSAERRARLSRAPWRRGLGRDVAARGGAAHGRRRAAAAAAVAGLLRAGEPAPSPAERARLAPRARRSGLPRGPARVPRLGATLFRRPLEDDRRCGGAAEKPLDRVDLVRDADDLGKPRRGARLQVAPRTHLRMRSLFWLLAVFAAAVALVVLGRVNAGYVLFVYPPWRVEFTMLAFAIAAVVSFLLLYGLFRLLGQATALP